MNCGATWTENNGAADFRSVTWKTETTQRENNYSPWCGLKSSSVIPFVSLSFSSCFSAVLLSLTISTFVLSFPSPTCLCSCHSHFTEKPNLPQHAEQSLIPSQGGAGCVHQMYDSHRWISELFITNVCLHLYVVTNALCVTINYEWKINVMLPIPLNKNSGWHAHLTLICNFEVTDEKPTSHFIRYTL